MLSFRLTARVSVSFSAVILVFALSRLASKNMDRVPGMDRVPEMTQRALGVLNS